MLLREFPTPFDGRVSIGPVGRPRLGYQVLIHGPSGQPLRSSRRGVSPQDRLDYTVCGQSSPRLAVHGEPGKRVELTVQRP